LRFLHYSTRASALKLKNFHSRLKILGWPTKIYGTFFSSKLLTDYKNVHAFRSTLTVIEKKFIKIVFVLHLHLRFLPYHSQKKESFLKSIKIHEKMDIFESRFFAKTCYLEEKNTKTSA
jgi:hypothetical protein